MPTNLKSDSGNLIGETIRKDTTFDALRPLIRNPKLISTEKGKNISYWVEMQKNGVQDGQSKVNPQGWTEKSNFGGFIYE